MRKEMTYTVTKVEIDTGKETCYGSGYSEKDVKDIVRGYKLSCNEYRALRIKKESSGRFKIAP